MTNTFAFPQDVNQKAGAVVATPDQNNFYIPSGGVLVPPAMGNVLNQVAANSTLTQSSPVSLASPVNITAAASGGQNDLNVQGMGFLSLQVSINGAPATLPTATLNFYGSADGTNFIPINGQSKSNGALSTYANGIQDIYTFDVRGLQYFRVLVVNYVDGTSGSSISATGVAEGFAGSGHFTTISGSTIEVPVDIHSIYYKTPAGNDGLPVYHPDGFGPGAGVTPTANANFMPVVDFPMLWNSGSNYDRMHNNIENSNGIYSSSARTATPAIGSTITNYNAKGALITLNITVAPATPTSGSGLQLKVIGIDANGKPFDMTGLTTLTTVAGQVQIMVYPGIGPAAYGVNATANFPLPRRFTAQVVHGNTDSYTYQVGYTLIL